MMFIIHKSIYSQKETFFNQYNLLSGNGTFLEQRTHRYRPSTVVTSTPHVLQTLSYQLLFSSTFLTVIWHLTFFCVKIQSTKALISIIYKTLALKGL